MQRMPLLVAATILACPAFAQPPPEARLYQIDARHSHVQFSVERFGFNAIIGEFRDVRGVVTLGDHGLADGSVTATVATASLASGDAERDALVKGEHWLDVARFPAISFQSTQVTVRDPGSATIAGEVTIHGVTRPVLLDVTLNRRGIDPSSQREAVGFSATGALRRTDFGIDTATALIGDDVRIRIEAIALQ